MRKPLVVCVLVLCVGCAGTTPTPRTEPIELRFATVPHLSRLAQDLSQAFSQEYPYVTFELTVMPSLDAIEAVASRDVDIALVAEPVESNREELESTQIGRRAVVLAVHPSNPVHRLTWSQVRDIFSGSVWDWAAIDPGRQTQEIVVISQHEGAISRSAFENQVMEGIQVTPRALVATGDELAGRLIANEPAAIGYLLAGVADDTVKVLNIDGMAPTPSAVASGTWPVTRPINLVIHIDAHVYVLDFVEFSESR